MHTHMKFNYLELSLPRMCQAKLATFRINMNIEINAFRLDRTIEKGLVSVIGRARHRQV